MEYIKTAIRSQPPHKFEHYTTGALDVVNLLADTGPETYLQYMFEDYIDDFVGLVITISQAHQRHVANAIMEGIHDVFPPDNDDGNDPILEKKLIKEEG
jgi:hypothetical protein